MSKFYENYKQKEIEKARLRHTIDSLNNTYFLSKERVTVVSQADSSIVVKGLKYKSTINPISITFISNYLIQSADIVGSLITDEISILYVNKDTREWPRTEGCYVNCGYVLNYKDYKSIHDNL